jgi:hypothetical protein
LLLINDPNIIPYTKGRLEFREQVMNTEQSTDLLSGRALEMAYLWALSCRSAIENMITFGNLVLSIKCGECKKARIFESTDDRVYDLSFIEPNIMYYPQEGKGKATHPLADLFFITAAKELVLVDIAGGRTRSVVSKVKRLLDWIEREKVNIPQYTVRGVVLAPNSDKVSQSADDTVFAVCGEDASALLGGLAQVQYLLKEDDVDEEVG